MLCHVVVHVMDGCDSQTIQDQKIHVLATLKRTQFALIPWRNIQWPLVGRSRNKPWSPCYAGWSSCHLQAPRYLHLDHLGPMSLSTPDQCKACPCKRSITCLCIVSVNSILRQCPDHWQKRGNQWQLSYCMSPCQNKHVRRTNEITKLSNSGWGTALFSHKTPYSETMLFPNILVQISFPWRLLPKRSRSERKEQRTQLLVKDQTFNFSDTLFVFIFFALWLLTSRHPRPQLPTPTPHNIRRLQRGEVIATAAPQIQHRAAHLLFLVVWILHLGGF